MRNDLLALSSIADEQKLKHWQKAVKTLFYKAKGKSRYINCIQPAIGWAKSLGLNEHDVNTYLYEFLQNRDSKKTEKDIKNAWKYAKKVDFSLPDYLERIISIDFVDLAEKTLSFIQEKREVARQELLRDIFFNQEWLCDKVMNFLESKNIVKSKNKQTNQKGRPPKIYFLEQELLNEQAIDRESEKALWR